MITVRFDMSRLLVCRRIEHCGSVRISLRPRHSEGGYLLLRITIVSGSMAEALHCFGALARGDDLAIARWRLGDESVDQPACDHRDLVDGSVERLGVRLRRFREAAQLADELHRRGADLLVGRGR